MNYTSEEIFNDNSYLGFDEIRFKHFDSLKIDFKNKYILELGSGIGNHTKFILSKKPKYVVSIEGREDNYDVLKSKYESKVVKSILHDLEKPIPYFDIKFDWIYNYGLLYHLKNPFQFVENLSLINHTNMILETCIELDGDENNLKEGTHQSQALNGYGSRPNIYKLISELKKIYKDVYYPIQPKHSWFNIHSTPPPVLKRIVIICLNKL
jgi:hypothetical protein